MSRGASRLFRNFNVVDTCFKGDLLGDEWLFKETKRRHAAFARFGPVTILSISTTVAPHDLPVLMYQLLSRLASQYPELVLQITTFAAMKRSVRSKRTDPLDKKRGS